MHYSRLPDHLRTCIDISYLGFVIDEYTDIEPAPIVRQMIELCKDAVQNPEKPRPQGEVIIGELTRQ